MGHHSTISLCNDIGGVVSGSGGAGALLLLLVPIASPLASGILVTKGFEIVSGLVEMLAVADGVEPISSPLASGIPVASGLGRGYLWRGLWCRTQKDCR